MSFAVAKRFVEESKLVTSKNYNHSDRDLLRRVQDINVEVGSAGRYIDVDQVDWGKNDTYYTGEVSDCTAFAIRRGDTTLFSHVQGIGTIPRLQNAITAFRNGTRRLDGSDNLYLWTMHSTCFWGAPLDSANPEFSPVNYDNSSIKVLIGALLGAYGQVAIQVLPKLTTIITGHSGVNWNQYCVASINGASGKAAGAYQRNSAAPTDPMQGLVLAKTFR
ncbi:MAG: hypothetical protein AAGH38_00020 [Pseudomonadota bacterium]